LPSVQVSALEVPMLREIYVRPTGLFPVSGQGVGEGLSQTVGQLHDQSDNDAPEEVRGGFRLAGGWLDFSALDIYERNGARVDRRITGLGEFFEKDWGRRTLNASDMFEAMLAPRARVAGLSFDRPRLMGIINVTPDSFSDGGAFATTQAAIEHAFRLEEDGADILDIGGESTRPGATPVTEREELSRVIPLIEGLAGKTRSLLSIDTRNAAVMRAAATAGCDLINDVSALTHDKRALETVAATGLPVVLMHAQGDPRTMQEHPSYDHVLLDVFDYLEARIEACVRAGIPRHKIIVDPGIGFGKTLAHNLSLLAGASLFHGLGVPILIGASRKGMIGQLTGINNPNERVHGSIGVALAAVNQGCQLLRVHDVAATRQALSVWMASTTGTAPNSGPKSGF
jgi:dihydropteroate synthase